MTKTAAYGSWESPISAEMLGSAAVKLGQTFIDAEHVYWIESRPTEKGRSVLVASDLNGKQVDLSLAEFNVRSGAHEYGGGAAIVCGKEIFFSNFSDHRIYKQEIGKQQAQALTKAGPYRYADFCFDPKRNRLIVVKEDHSLEGEEPLNSLDVVSLKGDSEAEMLLAGSDFFSSPRISPDGRLLAWITWNHPNMPWDETKLWTGNLGNDGSLSNIQQVAGGKGESVLQPEWGPDNTLYFVSDANNGWWNLHASFSGLVEPLLEMEAEFAYPHWIFGLSNYAVQSANKLICSYCQDGVWKLAEFNTDTRELKEISTPYQDLSYVRCHENRVLVRGGAPDRYAEIAVLDLADHSWKTIRKSNESTLDSSFFSAAVPIEFPTKDGNTGHAFYYAAKNPGYQAPEGTLPALIVKSHGGPTAACSSNLDLGIQFWTSRGFSVVDVNYGGSTGYGKKYRQRLNGQWGIVDVDDCVSAVEYLVQSKKVDGRRVAITGGSAGGYTTLCALAFRGTHFAAGASYYGVSDLEMLATDTHKFESRYLDSLVGPYPARKDLYEQRSPLLHAANIICPVIFFQGLEDKVVPPSQSESMYEALKKKHLPVAYLTFEGEQHGFRQAETIKRSLQSELSFYCRVFGISRSDMEQSLKIDNADKLPADGVAAAR